MNFWPRGLHSPKSGSICLIKRYEDNIRSFVSSVNSAACLNRKNVRLPKDAQHDTELFHSCLRSF